jgi:hypothetical protein
LLSVKTLLSAEKAGLIPICGISPFTTVIVWLPEVSLRMYILSSHFISERRSKMASQSSLQPQDDGLDGLRHHVGRNLAGDGVYQPWLSLRLFPH